VKLFSSKLRIVAVAVLILLVLFLFRPGASRLKSRIIYSISAAVGRSVDIGSVHLRLLPQPGFDLENLVVYDDPAFGDEPMLRASEVTADLRLTSLLRGRLEIARLDLTEPSLNLVHSENGRWNLEALLERTAHTPLAPTGKAKSEPRPGFPYIEATSARINFKNGPEKKPYALTNADFSLWQDSENAWAVRLRAQPFRSDLSLSDMGTLQVNGTWQRAATLGDTPLQFSIEWNRAQLGQLTKFFSGNDQGWRGGVQIDATLTGTPATLKVTSDASIQDFRRYDITRGQALRLAGHCEGQYGSAKHAFHDLLCNAPVGSGLITLKGNMGLPGSHNYGLILAAEDVPVSNLAALAQRAKKNLPDDLVAGGTVHGSVTIDEDTAKAAKIRLEGRGEIAGLHLVSAASNAEIGPRGIPFVLTNGDTSGRSLSSPSLRKSASTMHAPDGPHVEFGPAVSSGRSVNPTVRGWLSRAGYGVSVTGEAEIAKTLRITRMFGIPAVQANTDGTAQVDLQVVGSWAGRSNGAASGFSGPQVTGTAKLRNVRVAVRGTGSPVDILSADLRLLPDRVRVEQLSAKVAGTSWSGSLEMPRGCGTPADCQVHFILNANQIAVADISEWVNPRPTARPWYRVLGSSGQAGSSFLVNVRASGRVTADQLRAHDLAVAHVSASVSLDGGKLQVSELNGDLLGGKYRGEWLADFSGKPTPCTSSGNLTGISLSRLAETMKDGWIAGTASTSYEIKGSCSTEFWPSAEGTLGFDVSDGTLPHIALADDAGPLKIMRLTGHAVLRAGKLEMKDAKLDSSSGTFQLSGTGSLKRELDLKLTRTANGTSARYTITGTLAEPRVLQLPSAETQARLKPEPTK